MDLIIYLQTNPTESLVDFEEVSKNVLSPSQKSIRVQDDRVPDHVQEELPQVARRRLHRSRGHAVPHRGE